MHICPYRLFGPYEKLFYYPSMSLFWSHKRAICSNCLHSHMQQLFTLPFAATVYTPICSNCLHSHLQQLFTFPVHLLKFLHSLYICWNFYIPCTPAEMFTFPVHLVKFLHSLYICWNDYIPCTSAEIFTFPVHLLKFLHSLYICWNFYIPCTPGEIFTFSVHLLKWLHSLYICWNFYIPCTSAEISTFPVHLLKFLHSLYTCWIWLACVIRTDSYWDSKTISHKVQRVERGIYACFCKATSIKMGKEIQPYNDGRLSSSIFKTKPMIGLYRLQIHCPLSFYCPLLF